MIKILHLYYDLMNLYGDNGNIKALKYQLENQGIKVKIDFATIGDNITFKDYDVIYIGPGTTDNQKLVLRDILKYKKSIIECFNNNKFFLITGNSLELFGRTIISKNKNYKALGLFDFTCEISDDRVVGEIVAKQNGFKDYILAFQNQSSLIKTNNIFLFNIVQEKNINSNEGIWEKNFYGTSLIGPILVRNPLFLKRFVKNIINYKFKNFDFKSFDLKLETKAHSNYIINYYPNLIDNNKK